MAIHVGAVAIPSTDDGFPLVDMQVVGDVLARYPVLRMSFEEFLTLDEDFHGDWIDGRVRLLGGETRIHQEVVGRLLCLLGLYARDEGDVNTRVVMRPRPDLPAREVDLLYLRRDHEDRWREKFIDGPADLVVEIVSEESSEIDRTAKLQEYEAGGVREYWLVDPSPRRIEAFRLSSAGRYEPMELGEPAVIRSEALVGLELPAEWIWDERMPPLEMPVREWGLR